MWLPCVPGMCVVAATCDCCWFSQHGGQCLVVLVMPNTLHGLLQLQYVG